MFNKIKYFKNPIFILLATLCFESINSECTFMPLGELSAYKSCVLYKRLEASWEGSDAKPIPKDIIVIVLNYCEEMHLTGFMYGNLRFNLLLPAEKYIMCTEGPYRGRIEIRKRELKRYILTSIGFAGCKPHTINLGSYKYKGKDKPNNNNILYIKPLSIDQFLRKSNNHVAVVDVIKASDNESSDSDSDDGGRTLVKTESLYINKIFELRFSTNDTETLIKLCRANQLTYPSIDVEKLVFTCSDCENIIPPNQPLNMLGCAYVDPIRFRNGCQRLSRPIIATIPNLAKPRSVRNKYHLLSYYIRTSFLYGTAFIGTCWLASKALKLTWYAKK